MQDTPTLRVTAKTRILKFAEGADPAVDTPYEVVEQETVLVGEAAQQLLDVMGGEVHATIGRR